MTDKEKIKEEIKSYKESMKGLEPHSDFRKGQITAYNQILQFIDSLPEESGCEKKDYCERYEKLTQSDTFKSSYCDKSLGKEESTDEANCTTKSDDLEEAAKDILCAVLSRGITSGMVGIVPEKENLVKVGIEIADELVKQLKEKEEK